MLHVHRQAYLSMRRERISGSQKQATDTYVAADGIAFQDCAAGGETQVDWELKIEAAVLALSPIGSARILGLMYGHCFARY
jgi:hypothetical protein